ncbi:MAG: hypothetical protein OQK72_06570, partial [Gammaproteobacteria bacterium]|nr:hypothetical protein [Gammaproteobacteria bacterium]
NTYTPDAWGYIDVGANDVQSVTIAGSITDQDAGRIVSSISSLNFNFWNDMGISEYKQLQSNVVGGVGEFTVQIPVYQGHNWINFDAQYCDDLSNCNKYAYTYMGLETTTGTPWTPPIHDITVATAILTDDYGQSQNWNASADADNKVTVSGIMEYPTGSFGNPRFNISSDGAWSDGNLVVNADGSFSLPVSLYNGWNYVNFNDGEGNWFGVSIYTSAGETVIRPQIDTVGGVAYNGNGSASVTGCIATITGQSLANSQVQVNWNGDDGAGNYYYESLYLTAGADNGNGLGNFSVPVPVISGGYNYVDVFDSNWRGVSLQLSTSATGCTYTVPVLTVNSVIGNATLVSGTDYTSTANSVIVSGTSNIANRQIVVRNYTCSGEEKFETTSDVAGDWSVTANVYQDYNWLDISDGYNSQGVSVNSSTTVQPVAAITPVVTANAATPALNSSGCNYQNYDVGASTTVTISGTTTASDGQGTYWDVDGVMQTFTITGGAFTFTVNVYDGYNYVSVNDTNYNYYGFDLNTSNGVQRPRLVEITSPIHDPDGTIASSTAPGAYTVSGTIDTSSGFSANRVNAYVYDEATGVSINYTTSQADRDAYGYLLLNLGPDTGGSRAFSFDVTVSDSTYPFYISVDAVDEASWTYHGHSIYLNNIYNYGQWSYKPGAVVINQSAIKELKDRANKQRAGEAFIQMRQIK